MTVQLAKASSGWSHVLVMLGNPIIADNSGEKSREWLDRSPLIGEPITFVTDRSETVERGNLMPALARLVVRIAQRKRERAKNSESVDGPPM